MLVFRDGVRKVGAEFVCKSLESFSKWFVSLKRFRRINDIKKKHCKQTNKNKHLISSNEMK